MPVIELKLKNQSYPITVCKNANKKLIACLKRETKKNKLFLFYDANFYALHGKKLSREINHHINCHELVIPSGENIKSEKELSKIYKYLLSEKISRSDFIVAIGGGVTSDLIGYAAASTLRGIRWGVVSTTLLGMVDAAIGGKTGINHTSGKNLIGAFWQPSFVHSDINYLHTLSVREMNSGLGELVKYGGLIGKDMLTLLDKYLNQNNIYNENLLLKLISKSAEYKAKIVMTDERESGKRMFLNFGHTIGHAIENSLGYGKLRHGEAVLLGLYAALQLSNRDKILLKGNLLKYKEIIGQCISHIPYYPIDKQKLFNALNLDKKRIDSRQKFILLEKVSKPMISDDISKQMIEEAVDSMLYFYKHGVDNG